MAGWITVSGPWEAFPVVAAADVQIPGGGKQGRDSDAAITPDLPRAFAGATIVFPDKVRERTRA
jgi:hypothetical protein